MESIKSFTILRNSRSSTPTSIGDVVYKCIKGDYGSASQDTRMTGIRFISLTYDENGGYPFFTIPFDDVTEISEGPNRHS